MSDGLIRQDGTSVTVGSGSLLTVIHSERHVQCYTIQETELRMLTQVNDKSTACLSLGSIFLTIAISIWISASYANIDTAIARFMTFIGGPLALAVAIAFGVMAYMEFRNRNSLMQQIMDEAQPRS